MRQTLASNGITGDVTTILIAEATMIFLFIVAAVALHAAAYYGLRRVRPWGWISAVIVAAGWSLVLVGIPVLILLLRRSTRQRFGIR